MKNKDCRIRAPGNRKSSGGPPRRLSIPFHINLKWYTFGMKYWYTFGLK